MTQEHDGRLFFDEESFSLTVTVWSGSCDNFLNINTRHKHAEVLSVVRGRPRPQWRHRVWPANSQTTSPADELGWRIPRWESVWRFQSLVRIQTRTLASLSLHSFLFSHSLFPLIPSFSHFQQNPKLLPLTLSSDWKRQFPAEMAGLTSVWRLSKAIAACKMSFQNGSLLPTLHTMRLVDVLLVTTASVPPTTPRACDGGLADLVWREHVTVSGRGENSYTYFPY